MNSRTPIVARLLLLLPVLAAGVAWAQIAPPPEAPEAEILPSGGESSTEGHLTLRWASPTGDTWFQVEHAIDPEFTDAVLMYEGAATQSFFSGLEEGRQYYRVRAGLREKPVEAGVEPAVTWGPWTEPRVVEVEYQPMWLALLLFATGAAMFACIAGFVIYQTLSRRSLKGSGDA